MSDFDRLNAVIARFQSDQNVLVPGSSSSVELLTGLLRLIDETVLPREIQIHADEDVLVLHVAKRRLFQVSGCVSAELAEGQSDQLVSLGQEISGILSGKVLIVNTSRFGGELDQSAVGTSVDTLASAWAGLAEETTTSFEDLIALKSLAKVCWNDGEETERTGLKKHQKLVTVERANVRSIGAGERGLIVAQTGDADVAGIFAWDGNTELALLVQTSEINSILKIWP